MLNKLKTLFLSKKQKKKFKYSGAKLYIADMETNGVYFLDEQIKTMESNKEQKICQYSGLPSVVSYLD
jgi:aminopeptidase C